MTSNEKSLLFFNLCKIIKRYFIVIAFGFYLSIATATFAAESVELKAWYDFDSNLNDALGNATLTVLPIDLINHYANTTSGYGTDGGVGGDTTYWYSTSTEARGGGFYIDIPQALMSNDNYSIGLRFAYNEVSTGYDKIIDYQNRSSDNGFYFLNHKLMFYPGENQGSQSYTPGDILDLIITRNSSTKTFTAYFVLDGNLTTEFEYADTDDYAAAVIVDGNIRFGFFHDDIATASEAAPGGKVYSIKFWDGVINEESVTEAMDPKYILTFNDNVADEDITMPASQEVEEGNLATEPSDPTRNGYTFGGWYTTSTLDTFGIF